MIKNFIPLIRRGLLLGRDIKKLNYSSKQWLKAMKITPVNYSALIMHADCRHYAKGKDIKKNKKKSVVLDENELQQLFNTDKLFKEITKPIDHFKKELTDNTSLRSSQGVIENISIHFEGEVYKIQDLAEIGKKNPKLYILNFSAFPQTIPAVMATLQNSHLNINPQQDGTKIFVPVPKVTKEYREALAKKAKMYFFKCKEQIREVQIKYSKKLKSMENVSEETKFRVTDQLSALGNRHISVAEEILKTKQKELLQNEDEK